MFDTIVKNELVGGPGFHSLMEANKPGALGSILSNKKEKEQEEKKRKKK